jgi:hypothetical protein
LNSCISNSGTEPDWTAKYIIFETTAQIPEVEYGGKYGYMRANMDICPVFALRGQITNTDF